MSLSVMNAMMNVRKMTDAMENQKLDVRAMVLVGSTRRMASFVN
jgi:hypothetical protein